MDPNRRAVIRTYTVREHRPARAEFDMDFAVHPGGGPACRWAQRASVGDQVVVLGPTTVDNGGVDFQPPAGTDWILLAGDGTAGPAIAGILAWLPSTLPARTFLSSSEQPLVSVVRAAELPGGRPYAWIAGESAEVRALRRHLVQERGLDRDRVVFTGYWRRGSTEDDRIAGAPF